MRMLIASLTSLRFYAALMVFFSHILAHKNYGVGIDNFWIQALSNLGAAGVSIFFVLSGFILFINYLNPTCPPIQPYRFWLARVARIYPVYLVTLLMAFPMDWLHYRADGDAMFAFQLLIPHIGLAQSLNSEWYSALNPPSWSLGVEAIFYLLFPALGAFLVKKPLRNFAVMLTVYFLYQAFLFNVIDDHNYYAQGGFALNRLLEFICGMALGYLYATPSRISHGIQTVIEKTGSIGPGVVLLGSIAMLAAFPWLQVDYPILNRVYYLYFVFPAIGIVASLAFSEKFKKPLFGFTHPWIVFGGEISYSFYLVHHMAMRYLGNIFDKVFHWVPTIADPMSYAAGIVIVFSVSLILSVALYKGIEQPCRKWILAAFAPKPRAALDA